MMTIVALLLASLRRWWQSLPYSWSGRVWWWQWLPYSWPGREGDADPWTEGGAPPAPPRHSSLQQPHRTVGRPVEWAGEWVGHSRSPFRVGRSQSVAQSSGQVTVGCPVKWAGHSRSPSRVCRSQSVAQSSMQVTVGRPVEYAGHSRSPSRVGWSQSVAHSSVQVTVGRPVKWSGHSRSPSRMGRSQSVAQ